MLQISDTPTRRLEALLFVNGRKPEESVKKNQIQKLDVNSKS